MIEPPDMTPGEPTFDYLYFRANDGDEPDDFDLISLHSQLAHRPETGDGFKVELSPYGDARDLMNESFGASLNRGQIEIYARFTEQEVVPDEPEIAEEPVIQEWDLWLTREAVLDPVATAAMFKALTEKHGEAGAHHAVQLHATPAPAEWENTSEPFDVRAELEIMEHLGEATLMPIRENSYTVRFNPPGYQLPNE